MEKGVLIDYDASVCVKTDRKIGSKSIGYVCWKKIREIVKVIMQQSEIKL